VQLPLPPHIDTDAVLERIDPLKDADGLHPVNLGRLVNRVSGDITSPLPCTPQGIVDLMPLSPSLTPRLGTSRSSWGAPMWWWPLQGSRGLSRETW
jgi:hypothetical protein